MSTVRIAVAGAGVIGRRHIELIQASPTCELAAVVDPAPSAAGVAEAAGVPVHPCLGDLLGAQRPDGVIVATPNTLHVPNGLDCVAAGLPVLVEKPIGDTIEGAVRLVEQAAAARVPLLVGHHRQHSPILVKAREIVERGILGQIVAVTGSAVFYKPDDYFQVAPWRREPGGGPILINLIHEINALISLCGDVVDVQAMSSRSTRGFAVEDTAAILMRFASGALGTFMLSDTAASARSWEQTSGEDRSYASYADEDCYVIAGTHGSLAIPTMRLRVFPGRRSWAESFESSVVQVDRADPLARQLEHFGAVIRGEAQPLVTGREAVQTLCVTRAIAEATVTAQAVSTAAPA